MKSLCIYPGAPRTIHEAERHILIAHAERLTQEILDWKMGGADEPGWVKEFSFSGLKVTIEDITAGCAPRPRVVDMFAGGGAIPHEALRLGCEAYANDLNPVAHIIEICTLVYPQKYGKPDSAMPGKAGPKNEKGETTWGGLAAEVRFWGKWVLDSVKAEIGNLYPLLPDPNHKGHNRPPIQENWLEQNDPTEVPSGHLMPLAYLWTRTVKCKNPTCGASVPLVRQTWLCKKPGRYIALKIHAPRGAKLVRFEVVEGCSEDRLGFEPEVVPKGANTTCFFCGSVADSDYVMESGLKRKFDEQLMAVVCRRPGE